MAHLDIDHLFPNIPTMAETAQRSSEVDSSQTGLEQVVQANTDRRAEFRKFLEMIEALHEILLRDETNGDNQRELLILEQDIQRLAGIAVEEAS